MAVKEAEIGAGLEVELECSEIGTMAMNQMLKDLVRRFGL